MFPELTPRQSEVLALVAQGCSNDEIGARLGVSLATVKLEVAALFRHFDVTTRQELAAIYGRRAAYVPWHPRRRRHVDAEGQLTW